MKTDQIVVFFCGLLLVLFVVPDAVEAQNCSTTGCTSGLCCSQYGYCGSGASYCASLCNPACASGQCCSQYGYCGTGALYCGNGTTNSSAPVACNPPCSAPNCCSQFGYCGNGTSYCGNTSTTASPGITCPATSFWPLSASGSLVSVPCNASFEMGLGRSRNCSATGVWGNITAFCVNKTKPTDCMCTQTSSWPINTVRTNNTDVVATYACPGVNYAVNNSGGFAISRFASSVCTIINNTCAWSPIQNACCSCPADGAWPETEPGNFATLPCSQSMAVYAQVTRNCTVSLSGVCAWAPPTNSCALANSSICSCPAWSYFPQTIGGALAWANCSSNENGYGRVAQCMFNPNTTKCQWNTTIYNTCQPSTCFCNADGIWNQTRGGLTQVVPCGYQNATQVFQSRSCRWTNQSAIVNGSNAGDCTWDPVMSACPNVTSNQTSASHQSRSISPAFDLKAAADEYVKSFVSNPDQAVECEKTGSCSYVNQTHIVHARASGTCAAGSPCSDGSCCGQYNYCGYGSTYCGTGCQSNCNAQPPQTECGQYGATTNCPLNVCCSKFGYCGMTSDFCSTGCQNGCNWNNPPTLTCSGTNVVNVGYYASWAATRPCHAFTPENIQAGSYTHLLFAFAVISPSFQITPASSSDVPLYTRFTGLKQGNPNLKVGISVGGWAFNDPPTQNIFSNMASSASNRATFINSAVAFMNQYGFDHLDIDWEYPAASDRGGVAADKANFVSLLQEAKAALGGKILTVTMPASYWYLRGFDVPNVAAAVNWINLMTYDFHGLWDASIASLGPYLNGHTDLSDLQGAVNLLTKAGAPSNKLVLGLGLYGRSFTMTDTSCITPGGSCQFSGGGAPGPCTGVSGTLALFEINQMIASQGLTPILNTTDQFMYLVYNTNSWVAYDNTNTIQVKKNLVNSMCMMGYMTWSVDQDDTLITSTSNSHVCQQEGSWPVLAAGTSYTATCADKSTVTRSCNSNGVWAPAPSPGCGPLISLKAATSPANASSTPDTSTCWKRSYGRGAGYPLTTCPSNSEKNGALCYPLCKAGYYGVGPLCWESCQPGFTDEGALCAINLKVIGADNSGCPWYDKCGLTFKKGCSKCPAGYKNEGCLCQITPNIYAKKTYGRGVGFPLSCAPGQQQDVALCYPPCNNGYYGIGPVCWQTCPTGTQTCSALCVADTRTCGDALAGIIGSFVGTAIGVVAAILFPPAGSVILSYSLSVIAGLLGVAGGVESLRFGLCSNA